MTPEDKTSKSKSQKTKKTSSKEKTKPKAKPKTKEAEKPKTKPKAKPKAKAKAAQKPKAKPKAKAKTKAKVKAKPRGKTRSRVKSKAAEKPMKPAVQKVRPHRIPLAEPVVGVLMNYQRGTVTQRHQYGLIQLKGVDSVGKAAAYIGRTAILHFNEDISITGRVVAVHGRSGILRVRFSRNLASEAISKEVKVF